MNAYKATHELAERLTRRGITLTYEQANTLRRAPVTLHGWCELECGNNNDYASWSIVRGHKIKGEFTYDDDGTPFIERHNHNENKARYSPVRDREKGALKRIKAVCNLAGLHFYYQTDPRGCALYVSREPLTDQNYSSLGVPCCG